MPLFRPTGHAGMLVKLSPGDKPNCAACPDTWFWLDFDTEFYRGPLGVYVLMDDGSFRHLHIDMPAALASGFPADRIFPVGSDGHYLSMAQARTAIDLDRVTSIYYVDDYSDEYQDFYVCKDDDDHTPFVEARVAEPIR